MNLDTRYTARRLDLEVGHCITEARADAPHVADTAHVADAVPRDIIVGEGAVVGARLRFTRSPNHWRAVVGARENVDRLCAGDDVPHERDIRWRLNAAHVSIGDDVTIGAGAVIRPGAVIGDGAVIGAGAWIEGGAVVCAGAIVTAGAVVPAGTVVPAGAIAYR